MFWFWTVWLLEPRARVPLAAASAIASAVAAGATLAATAALASVLAAGIGGRLPPLVRGLLAPAPGLLGSGEGRQREGNGEKDDAEDRCERREPAPLSGSASDSTT